MAFLKTLGSFFWKLSKIRIEFVRWILHQFSDQASDRVWDLSSRWMSVTEFRKDNNILHSNQSLFVGHPSCFNSGSRRIFFSVISLVGIHSEENHEVPIDQTVAKSSLFQTKKALSLVLYWIRSSVLVAAICQFVPELEQTAGKITDGNFARIFHSCKEIGLEEFPVKIWEIHLSIELRRM
jgi:hypothetical protein